MKLYFNYRNNIIIAKHNDETIDMRTGKPTDDACNAVLNSYDKLTSSKWIAIDDMLKFSNAIQSIADEGATGRLIAIDGHTVNIRYQSVEGINYVQFVGHFPVYFWKGLTRLIQSRKEH